MAYIVVTSPKLVLFLKYATWFIESQLKGNKMCRLYKRSHIVIHHIKKSEFSEFDVLYYFLLK